MRKIRRAFKEIGINITPGGVWKYDADGVKEAVDAMRQDGLDWKGYRGDNMAKYRPELSGHYVLDLDNMAEAEKLLPKKIWKKAMKTFRYNTSKDTKMHCVFKRVDDVMHKRVIWSGGAFDSMPSGNMFTAHLLGVDGSAFKLYADKVQTITSEEISTIESFIPRAEGMSVSGWEAVPYPTDTMIDSLGVTIGEVVNDGMAASDSRCDCPFNADHTGGGKGYGFVTSDGMGVGCNSCHKIMTLESGGSLDGEVLEAVTMPGGRDEDVDELVWDGIIGRFVEMRGDKLRYHPQSNFKQTLRSRYGWTNKMVTEHLGTIPAKEVVYRPGGECAEDELNVWRGVNGWETGSYDKIDKILDNLFISQEDAREVFVEWMAYVVQTQKRTGVAWGFFGAAGSGKGFVAEMFANLVGGHNTKFNIGDDLLQSAFNEYAYRVQFIHLNEIASDFHGRHGVAGKLKSLVADPQLSINIKNMPIFATENYANVILNSNKANPIELDMDDRRWNMVVSEQSLTKCRWWYEGYYEEAMSQWQAFGAMLKTLKVDEKRVRKPMKISAAKQKIIEQTVPQVQQLSRFINERDAEGLMDFLELDPDDLSTQELRSDIEEAVSLRLWSGALLTELYQIVSDNKEASTKLMVLRLKTPYLKGSYGEYKIKGSKIRGLKQ